MTLVDHLGVRRLRADASRPLCHPGAHPVRIGVVGQGVGVQFHDTATGPPRPRPRLLLVAAEHAVVVQRAESAGAQEDGPVGVQRPAEPQAGDQEGGARCAGARSVGAAPAPQVR
ncbi:hypothetical protein GCM10010266_47450 [Streptomyces griseomycini]|nr:hypothetical protein GCM10010266_47450 [Streptomyces griseomycini]